MTNTPNTPLAIERTLHTAHGNATTGREGRVTADGGALDLALSVPKGLGGSGGAGTNPEQLFAAGYAACFSSAITHVARQKKLSVGSVEVDTAVSIGPIAGGAFGLAVTIVAHLPELSAAEADALVAEAHAVCPYSNATRGNIEVTLRVAD
ncbi:MAG: organic hydroperoxide resistance protein [Sandaracinus sp.]|nr:organic hydroperoxide resistance protein [Sandaracinus sp.]|tara:strand:+ start:367 stop:819 length:453 start_codon:yes stop_codon:yes gene_type:complete